MDAAAVARNVELMINRVVNLFLFHIINNHKIWMAKKQRFFCWYCCCRACVCFGPAFAHTQTQARIIWIPRKGEICQLHLWSINQFQNHIYFPLYVFASVHNIHIHICLFFRSPCCWCFNCARKMTESLRELFRSDKLASAAGHPIKQTDRADSGNSLKRRLGRTVLDDVNADSS